MTGVGSMPGVSFRGLGSNSALFSVETSVAVFIDGVYMGHTRDYVTPIYDLSRIEMIKGTQATLLGKNTSLGAMSMITNQPEDRFGADLRASHEFNTDTNRFEGFVNIPVDDTLAVRVAGLFSDDGGYYHNAFTGRGPDTKDGSGRIEALWTPIAPLTVLLSYQHDTHDKIGQELEILRDGGVVAGRAAAIGQTNFEALPNRRDESGSGAVGAIPALPSPSDHQHTDHVTLTANYDWSGYTVTSETAYLNWKANIWADLDFTQGALFNLHDLQTNEQFTQELRIASPTDQDFTYLAGAYFLYNGWNLDRTLIGHAPHSLTGSVEQPYKQRDTTISLFAHGTYNFTDAFNISAGIRLTHDLKKGFESRAPGTGVLGVVTPPIATTTLTKDQNSIDGDVGVQYKFDAQTMIYASWSTGSKSGGFQNMPTTIAGAPYGSERAYTTEIGGKFLFDPAMSLDVALFDTYVSGFQFSHVANVCTPAPVTCLTQTVVDNSYVLSRGAELSGAWSPFSEVQLHGGVVYANTYATKDSPAAPAPAVQVKGLQQPRAPQWSGTFGALLTHPLADSLVLTADANVEFSSKVYLQPNVGTTAGAPLRNGYAKVNIRLAVGDTDRGWEVALLGRNLTNVQEPEFATTVIAGGTSYYGSMSRPATVALQVEWHL
jgi:iron complex outermembrane recepter protein